MPTYRATITATFTVTYESEQGPDGELSETEALEAFYKGLHRALYDDHEPYDGSIGREIIEPHVDSIEEVE